MIIQSNKYATHGSYSDVQGNAARQMTGGRVMSGQEIIPAFFILQESGTDSSAQQKNSQPG